MRRLALLLFPLLAIGCGINPLVSGPGIADDEVVQPSDETDQPAPGDGLSEDAPADDSLTADTPQKPPPNSPPTGDKPEQPPADDTPPQIAPNVPPVAVIAVPQFGDTLDTVYVDGAGSFDSDGAIVSWRWFVQGVLIGVGWFLEWDEVPVGTSDLFLVVTDDDGATAFDSVQVVRVNLPPVAIAEPGLGEGPDEVLHGLSSEAAFLGGWDSYDPDGRIQSWDWYAGALYLGPGPSLTWTGAPVGVTIVTLVVTDDHGAQATDEVRVVQPGFRSGLWRGVTNQGYQVEFEISGFVLFWSAFGYEFTGESRQGPCRYSRERQECTGLGCLASAELCGFSSLWGVFDLYSFQGGCVAEGDPPYEHARGTARASPRVNVCVGLADDVTWEAWWVSE